MERSARDDRRLRGGGEEEGEEMESKRILNVTCRSHKITKLLSIYTMNCLLGPSNSFLQSVAPAINGRSDVFFR